MSKDRHQYFVDLRKILGVKTFGALALRIGIPLSSLNSIKNGRAHASPDRMAHLRNLAPNLNLESLSRTSPKEPMVVTEQATQTAIEPREKRAVARQSQFPAEEVLPKLFDKVNEGDIVLHFTRNQLPLELGPSIIVKRSFIQALQRKATFVYIVPTDEPSVCPTPDNASLRATVTLFAGTEAPLAYMRLMTVANCPFLPPGLSFLVIFSSKLPRRAETILILDSDFAGHESLLAMPAPSHISYRLASYLVLPVRGAWQPTIDTEVALQQKLRQIWTAM